VANGILRFAKAALVNAYWEERFTALVFIFTILPQAGLVHNVGFGFVPQSNNGYFPEE
jgi:hypothetical protein